MKDQTPSYLGLLATGQLEQRVAMAKEHLTKCNLCPHHCGVDRRLNVGFCRAKDKALVSSYGPHFGEEAP